MFYEIYGTGNTNLVLLHGWGLNSKIWDGIHSYLMNDFSLYLIDLPGFGINHKYVVQNLEDMIDFIIPLIPKNSIILGWSLGGLVAIKLASIKPDLVKGLITVSTSPCFCTRYNWPGMKFKILQNFNAQLSKNLKYTIKNFLIMQTLKSNITCQDLNKLEYSILSQPFPSLSALNYSLNILYTNDLRPLLKFLRMPCLSIYGYLDNLVPIGISKLLENYWTAKVIIMYKDYHAPFISHPKNFCDYIINFNKNYINNVK